MCGCRSVCVAWLVAFTHLLQSPVFSLSTPQQALRTCHPIGNPSELPVLKKEGDINLGGLFSLHDTVTEPDLSFTSQPGPVQCSGFNFRTFRWMQTMIFAIEKINRINSLLPNITLGYRIYDSCSTHFHALRTAMTLMGGSEEENASTSCSGTVPVSYFSSCACLSNKLQFPAFLRTMPSDFFQVDALAQLVKHFGWTWVGVVAGDDAYGRGGAQIFVDKVRMIGACIALHEIIPKNHGQVLMSGIVERIHRSRARVVLLFALEQDAGALLKEALRQNLTEIQWLASEAWITAAVLSTAEFHPILQGSLGFAIRRAIIPDLQPFLLRLHPSMDPEDPFLQQFWQESFGCQLLGGGEMISTNKPACSGAEDLANLHNIYTDVSQLRISYNVYKAVYAIAHALDVPLSVCSQSCPPGTRKANKPNAAICCFDCVVCAAGEISNQTDAIECVQCLPEFWSNPRRDACIPKDVEFLSYEDNMGMTMLAVALVGSCCTLTVTFIFACHRTTPIVRANNSELSFLILSSLWLCFLCALPFIGEPTTWSCMLRHTAFAITFSLCISCILGKTIVVLMAFQATLPGSTVMKWFGPLQQRAMIFMGAVVQVVICGVWLAVAPPTPRRLLSRESSRVILLCDLGSALGFSLVLGYIGLLSTLCLLLAFLARKLPGNFNEAKLITFSMLIFFAVWVSFVPAYVSSPGKYSTATEVFAILASSYGLLACLFLPKCYIILLKPEKNTRKHLMSKFAH
uniref:G-protein coupled receptors family 3 profile domain-containing protein n=1 Tax=Denticeps clupeoides TaxID=299321 RepID=A0AAY4CCK3_9TELE